jgi:hypothetical protein
MHSLVCIGRLLLWQLNHVIVNPAACKFSVGKREAILSSEVSFLILKELKGVGIEVPATLSQTVLLQLFKANSDKTVINSTVALNNNLEGITTTDSDTRMNTMPILIPGSSVVNDSNETLMNPIPAEQRTASSAANTGGNMSHVLNAFSSMTQCFSGLQDTVTQLLKKQPS